ncbi:MAG: hypothetical protein HYS25_11605 [Ignavibacteriales bacterium]|nr:hypothetical protein [Ignavibacteriales bacterium]
MKKKFYIRIFSLLVFSFFLNSCSDKKDAEDSSSYFSFDKSKIGIEVADQELGIKFNPPAGWDLTPASISKKIESRGSANDSFIYKPTYIFFNGTTGSLLSVGKVITNDSTLSKSSVLNYYKGLISSKHKNDKLSIGKFINSKIAFTQFEIRKENLLSFKIIFENRNREIIQFDYTIRQNSFDKSESVIKASIGSIRNL